MIDSLLSPEGGFVGTSDTFGAEIVTCDRAEGLTAIGNPGMELVIWRRELPWRLQTWLDRINASCLPDLRVAVQPCDLRRAVEPHFDDCGMPPGDMRDLLLGDLEDLVSAFAMVTRSDIVDVRLEGVSHDACWKFHRDCVDARLLTTYRGPATEWVQPIDAERALREQKSYAGPLQRLRVHDVAIFKGSCVGPGRGIVHRSPPITGTGCTRLLLCLNELSDISPKSWTRDVEHETQRS